jgi:hypothetical protein
MAYPNSAPESARSTSLPTPSAAALSGHQEAPIISIMQGYFVVNATALRTRANAKALRELIERLEWMLPDETAKAAVSDPRANEPVADTIDDGGLHRVGSS